MPDSPTRPHTSMRAQLMLGMLAMVLLSNLVGFLIINHLQTQRLQHQLIALADTELASLSQDFVKLIVFDDPQVAVDISNRLHEFADIHKMEVHNNVHAVVFRYQHSSHHHTSPALQLIRPVRYQGITYGTAYLEIDTGSIAAASEDATTSLLLALAGAFLLALAFAWWVQRQLTQPVMQLQSQLSDIANKNDPAERTQVDATNEIAGISDRINALLEKIRAQEALLHSRHAQLEHLVEVRTADLKHANKELEAFSYSVSHDLRAPLRSIDGFSLALEEDYGDQLPADAHDYLNRIRRAAQRMGQLIDDLLSLARAGSGNLKKSRFELPTLIRTVMTELKKQHSEQAIEWQIKGEISAYGDTAMLSIVLENLLGNAIKYSAKKDISRLQIQLSEDTEHSQIEIRDNGAGFDMRYASKLFTPFQRLHGKEFEGSGIGLATVARIIYRHGGDITAQATPGQGATFTVTLPLVDKANAEPTPGKISRID